MPDDWTQLVLSEIKDLRKDFKDFTKEVTKRFALNEKDIDRLKQDAKPWVKILGLGAVIAAALGVLLLKGL